MCPLPSIFLDPPLETFHVSVAAVGQRNGTVSTNTRGHLGGYVYAFEPLGNLHPHQYLQATCNTCTILNYTVFSQLDTIFLILSADGHCSRFGNELHLILYVNQTYPSGFNSKLTVATGTLSGLEVFYANIVGVNHTIFIPVESTNILSVFIAWLNLDFGV